MRCLPNCLFAALAFLIRIFDPNYGIYEYNLSEGFSIDLGKLMAHDLDKRYNKLKGIYQEKNISKYSVRQRVEIYYLIPQKSRFGWLKKKSSNESRS